MNIQGGWSASICAQFQTFLNSVQGGVDIFQKCLNYLRGGRGFMPNREFVPKGPRENVISDLNMLFVMAGIIVLILND